MIGATTITASPTAIAPTMLLEASSSSGASVPNSSSRPTSRPRISSPPSTASPTVSQNGVARSPKCHGWGLTRREAKNTAIPTSAASWTSTSTSSAMPATASPASVSRATGSNGKPAAMVTPKAEKKAAGAIHAGQRGRAARGSSG